MVQKGSWGTDTMWMLTPIIRNSRASKGGYLFLLQRGGGNSVKAPDVKRIYSGCFHGEYSRISPKNGCQ